MKIIEAVSKFDTTTMASTCMRSIKCAARVIKTLCAGLLILGSIHGHADTIHLPYSNSSFTANFNNLGFSSTFSPSRDVAAGTVLQTVSQNGRITYVTTCDVDKVVTVNGTPVPGMTDTYQTNVPGIGVHFYVSKGWDGNWSPYISVPSNETLSPSTHSDPASFYTRADLVVTGRVGNGTLTNLPTMTVTYSGTCITPGYGDTPHTQALNAGTTITGRTCSVTTPAVTVALPTVFPSNLNTGSTGAAPFSLGVNCTQGVVVNVTLTDASNVTNTSTTLSLALGSTATGVGVQILNGSTPVAYGPDSAIAGNTNQWSVGTAAGGPMTIPLTARYVKTGTVTPGTVNALATFTMSYQ